MAAEQDLTFLQRALGLRCSGLDGRLETSPSLNYNAIQAHDSSWFCELFWFWHLSDFPIFPHGRLEQAQILNVDASGAVLNEHLGELHSGGDASMASVCICDDGIQVVLIAIRVGSKKNCTEFMHSKPSVSHTNVSLARARSTTAKCYCAATMPTMPSKHQPLESWRARLASCDVAPRTACDRGRAGLGRADPPD